MSGHLDYEINKELGECYLFMGELDKAEEYYRKAVSSNGVHPDPYLGLATVAVQRGDLEDAEVMYRKAHKIEPSDKSLSGIALIRMENGDRDEAFTLFVEALGMNPENMVALFSLIRLGHETERIGEIIPHLENYLEIDPAKHEVRYSLAGCLACVGQMDAAIRHLELILDKDPENASAREMLDQFRS
ncbi:Tetratricopeptide TPR_1 repeat-containing protein [Pseudodesulfovibrio mercurii]|uniref:Tetratricopeptide TPR_1 repeat-containing protein n=1 Tax=Pseudodesulfovibrio mercurii TaxID=641491 RepID=F0JBH6_9BACT|nr:tetratricopeptide repeat protein [Pseudodesulfovibrio mercurii]EGB14295.1 Tetratricopeptide TPR_1 repeat-containing protein [Pseudodesulfovibrio mercurii]